ncbi:RidA family protein [Paraburkholderia nodosa]|uniref:RidA family protein n=1 Tax=Paraburkholderia nodosa TaxID=392320 RepID=UPI000480C88B|nr:RidA family protein [Paraburkholderia nodosa]
MSVEQKLADLGLALPDSPQPLGNYKAVSEAGHLLFISGQGPLVDGRLRWSGRVGAELTLGQGREAAQLTALNVLAQIKRHLGSFERLHHIVRMEGHVSSAEGFLDQPTVLDAASDLFTGVLGEKAGHARSAFSPPRLPLDLPVELVVIAQILPA